MFEDLGLLPSLLEAVTALGFKEPTKIQELTIPKILSGNNLIGQAPTGTGKTMAYLLPIFQKMDSTSSTIQAVILSPTYELAMQTARTAQDLSKFGIGLKVQGLIGGANIARQIESLKKKPQIIVGSAGRILELSRKNKLNLRNVKIFVLDEFDRLLDDQNYKSIVEVKKLIPVNAQILMFSATAPNKALKRAEEISTFELIKASEDKKFAAERENLYKVVDFRDKIAEVRKLTRRLPIKRGLVFINKSFDAEITFE